MKREQGCGWTGEMPKKFLYHDIMPNDAEAIAEPPEKDCARFGGGNWSDMPPLSREGFLVLYQTGYLDPNSAQNESPNVREFFTFLNDHNFKVYFEGYRVSDNRYDRRIEIDGIYIESAAMEGKRVKDFFSENAPDEYDAKKIEIEGVMFDRLWWD